ncbi:MAG: GMC family oxidoreductase [Myxococcales bacterium]|nr:GMC family oxidoreductase [Myxococcales bacterium]
MTASAVRQPDYGPPPPSDLGDRTFDVCIIGSGASGSVAADELARAGLEVVVVEQGPYVGPSTLFADVVHWAEPAYVRVFSGCFALQGNPWSSCNVGGGTVFFGGASFRYRRMDFDASRWLPAADLPVAFPYDYDELEPYYGELEQRIGVAADPAGDPTAPPAPSARYLPPVAPSRAAEVLFAGARALGLRAFPTPLCINTVPYAGRAECANLTPCIEHRCERFAKGDAETIFLRPLLEAGSLTLCAGLKAVRLERSARARVSSLVAVRVDTGQSYRISARRFVLAANAIQSAALLLRSADDLSPSGLGNDTDMVGRGLCFKISEWVDGFVDAGPDAANNDGPFSTFALTDHYLDAAAPSGLGGLIYEASFGHRFSLHRGLPVRVECILADHPARDNRVLLSRDLDAHGLPRIIMDYTPHPTDLARREHMVDRSMELLRAAGCRLLRREGKAPHFGGTHLHGGCRAGSDPATSVVDGWGRVHGLDNLFVIDGGFMPYPGGVNPTLTIQANALRAARNLAREGA